MARIALALAALAASAPAVAAVFTDTYPTGVVANPDGTQIGALLAPLPRPCGALRQALLRAGGGDWAEPAFGVPAAPSRDCLQATFQPRAPVRRCHIPRAPL